MQTPTFKFTIHQNTDLKFKLVDKKDFCTIDNIDRKISCVALVKANGEPFSIESFQGSCGCGRDHYCISEVEKYIKYEFEGFGTYEKIKNFPNRKTFKYELEKKPTYLDYITVTGPDAHKLLYLELQVGGSCIVRAFPEKDGIIKLLDTVSEVIPIDECKWHEFIFEYVMEDNSNDIKFEFHTNSENKYPIREKGDNVRHTWMIRKYVNDGFELFRIYMGMGTSMYYSDGLSLLHNTTQYIYFYDTPLPTHELSLQELVEWLNNNWVDVFDRKPTDSPVYNVKYLS